MSVRSSGVSPARFMKALRTPTLLPGLCFAGILLECLQAPLQGDEDSTRKVCQPSSCRVHCRTLEAFHSTFGAGLPPGWTEPTSGSVRWQDFISLFPWVAAKAGQCKTLGVALGGEAQKAPVLSLFSGVAGLDLAVNESEPQTNNQRACIPLGGAPQPALFGA